MFQVLLFFQQSDVVNQSISMLDGLNQLLGDGDTRTTPDLGAPNTALINQVRTALCTSENHTEYLLVLDNPQDQVELVNALCNLTTLEFTELFEDFRDDSSMTELVRQMSVCSEKHLGEQLNYNQQMIDNLTAVMNDVSSIFYILFFIHLFYNVWREELSLF